MTNIANRGSILALSAYLVREACGLDDNTAVTLDIGAEAVRKLVLAAVKEHDELCAAVRATSKSMKLFD